MLTVMIILLHHRLAQGLTQQIGNQGRTDDVGGAETGGRLRRQLLVFVRKEMRTLRESLLLPIGEAEAEA